VQLALLNDVMIVTLYCNNDACSQLFNVCIGTQEGVSVDSIDHSGPSTIGEGMQLFRKQCKNTILTHGIYTCIVM